MTDKNRGAWQGPGSYEGVLPRLQEALNSSQPDGNLSTSHGFLPPKMLVRRLPPAFDEIEDFLTNLPRLVYSHTLQKEIAQLPAIDASEGTLPTADLQRAAVAYGILAAAYWRCGVVPNLTTRNSDIDNTLPQAILQPWITIAKRLGRPRHYQSIDDLTLNNFRVRQPVEVQGDGEYDVGDVAIENLENLIPVFDNEPERVFYGAFVEIHAVTAPLIKQTLQFYETLTSSNGPDLERLDGILEHMAEPLVAARKAFAKVSPVPGRKTYCDPLMWSKTIAAFNIPPKGYPSGPMSGATTPFAHLLDELLGRREHSSYYGNFTQKIRMNYLPSKVRSFLDVLNDFPLRDVICFYQIDPVWGPRLAEHFNGLVELFASGNGFLGKHLSKVFNYLGVGTLVGRNQSTSGDERYAASNTWAKVTEELRVASIERKTHVLPSAEQQSLKSLSTEVEENAPATNNVTMSELVMHRVPEDAWLVMDGRVFDVTPFLSRHPGGTNILRMFLGRDGSSAFAAIPGHQARGIRKQLSRLEFGQYHPLPRNDVSNPIVKALDYAAMVDNSFQAQSDHSFGRPAIDLIYRCQFLVQVCGEHIPQMLEMLSRVPDEGSSKPSVNKVIEETNAACHSIKEQAVASVLQFSSTSGEPEICHGLLKSVQRFSKDVMSAYIAELASVVSSMYESGFQHGQGEVGRLVEGVLEKGFWALQNNASEWG